MSGIITLIILAIVVILIIALIRNFIFRKHFYRFSKYCKMFNYKFCDISLTEKKHIRYCKEINKSEMNFLIRNHGYEQIDFPKNSKIYENLVMSVYPEYEERIELPNKDIIYCHGGKRIFHYYTILLSNNEMYKELGHKKITDTTGDLIPEKTKIDGDLIKNIKDNHERFAIQDFVNDLSNLDIVNKEFLEETKAVLFPKYRAEFNGTDEELIKFFDSHVVYPKDGLKNKITGKVVFRFIVTKDGDIGDAKILRSLNEDFDKEAIRVSKLLPKFKPGMNSKRIPIDSWYTVIYEFKLPKENIEKVNETKVPESKTSNDSNKSESLLSVVSYENGQFVSHTYTEEEYELLEKERREKELEEDKLFNMISGKNIFEHPEFLNPPKISKEEVEYYLKIKRNIKN